MPSFVRIVFVFACVLKHDSHAIQPYSNAVTRPNVNLNGAWILYILIYWGAHGFFLSHWHTNVIYNRLTEIQRYVVTVDAGHLRRNISRRMLLRYLWRNTYCIDIAMRYFWRLKSLTYKSQLPLSCIGLQVPWMFVHYLLSSHATVLSVYDFTHAVCGTEMFVCMK